MSSFFSAKKDIVPLNLVLDIESGSIGAGLYMNRPGKKPIVLYTARENFVYQKDLNGQVLFSAMFKALETILDRIENAGLVGINENKNVLHVIGGYDAVLSSPWYLSEIKTLKALYATPHQISQSSINKLFDTEEREFESKSEISQQNKNADPYLLLERKILRTNLNGYSTDKPIGKTARELELIVAISLTPRVFLEGIKSAVTRKFPSHQLGLHTFSLAAFSTIRDIYSQEDDFIFMHVGGEVTDIVVVKKGTIADTASFPLGRNTILRDTEKIFSGTPHGALESLVKIALENKSHSLDLSKIQIAINDTKTSWLKFFNDALSSFSDKSFLPNTLFFQDNSPFSKIFMEFLKGAESNRFTVTSQPFSVIAIDASLSKILVDYEKDIVNESSIAVEVNFLSRLY
ncbi:MAG: hypothetical protein EXS46_02220 [Candidatus Taylorbacteria bacterium]|nr:hypothetical protein [Candidatus Taylorbacteria bacterium]